jgi:AAA+ ATPase superfamily predicted ATPase
MEKNQFIGRDIMLDKLSGLLALGTAKLIVLKGRRRIGKSRLMAEFGKKFKKTVIFSGLPPEPGITAADQRQEFADQLQREFGIRGIKTDDWSDLFWHLSQKTQVGRILIVLDEITWMAQGDVTFLAKLKNAWDLYFKKNPTLILALCSSISGWIEENILNSTGFFGRISLNITLDELPIKDCVKFWDRKNDYITNQDKLILLSITGGVPRYLEEINPKQTAEQNIMRLCFDRDGILFSEFDHIFSDLFSKRSELYKQIVSSLVNGGQEVSQIASLINKVQSNDIYNYLDALIMAGFVSRDYTWHFKDGKLAKLSHYRLKDNYSRFYLKYILPNKEKIVMNAMPTTSLTTFSHWSTIIGLQLENLVLQNRNLIKQTLGISADAVVCDNPYFQRKTSKQDCCQIDYLIQTKYNTLFVCEIKYTKNTIKSSIIDEVKQKINRLTKPKNFSCVPVLIYCGAIHESIEESGYFVKIINFEKYLE